MSPRRLSIPLLALAATLLACGRKSPPEPTDDEPTPQTQTVAANHEFTLAPGHSATIDGTLTVTLQKVAEDSRCPVGGMCVWAGDVAAVLTLQHAGTRQAALTDTLHTNVEPRQLDVLGLRLVVTNVTPEKRGPDIPQRYYRVTLKAAR